MEERITQNKSGIYDILLVEDNLVYINGQLDNDFEYNGFPVSIYPVMEIPNNKCPFCNHNLISCGDEEYTDSWIENPVREYNLWYCRNCRFWQWYYYADEFGYAEHVRRYMDAFAPIPPEQTAFISKLREFDVRLPSSCNEELAQYLRSNPNKLNTYNPQKFEKLVTDIFKANYKNAEVIHVGKPDDGGVDIFFIDSDDQQWLVQVKRREKLESSEGVTTIRNLLGAMILEGKTQGVLVSTADHFTLRAKQAVNKAKGIGFYIELIDKGALNRMIEPILPDRPWFEPIKVINPKLADLLLKQISSDNQPSLFDFFNQ